MKRYLIVLKASWLFGKERHEYVYASSIEQAEEYAKETFGKENVIRVKEV
jgi:hypothetical protein